MFRILVISCISIFILSCDHRKTSLNESYTKIEGNALGTTYHITYKDKKKINYHDSIKSILNNLENSLSVYRQNSIISKVNNNEKVDLDSMFIKVFKKAEEINKITDGAFDITAAPIFDLWGWGAKQKVQISDNMIDSVLMFVGHNNIYIDSNRIVKTDSRSSINMNAIAKGYASDLISYFFQSVNINDFMIEIGGEIVVKGNNPKGKLWRVGIDMPIDSNMISGKEIANVIEITDKAIATSGDYRRFYIENGEKFGHSINPKTGFPARQNILSATVIAESCMEADAYATAFMVLGLDKSKIILNSNKNIQAYLIYSENGELKEYN